MSDDRIIQEHASTKGLAIVHRYMGFVNYIYPMTTNWSGKHRVFRDTLVRSALEQIQLFYDAAKSNQISRLYMADSGLASLREFLRFAADPSRRLMSRRQHEVAETHIAETGAMLGKWIAKHKQGRSR